ncbi:MAG: hypothetical protein IBJ19_07835 [Gemmatimonadaceae bacterium]|nr:hypothetical protein [Gemmatimonadaceae bacterium]
MRASIFAVRFCRLLVPAAAAFLLTACGQSDDVVLADSAALATPGSLNKAPEGVAVTNAADAAPKSELPGAVVQKAKDNQTPEFLSLFEAPSQTVVLSKVGSVRLIDLVGTAANAPGNPKADLEPGMTSWSQVEGPKTLITDADSPNATATIGQEAWDQDLVYRVSIRNASGGRSLDVKLRVTAR